MAPGSNLESRHAFHELILVLAGEYRLHAPGLTLSAKPGEAVAIPGGSRHRAEYPCDGSNLIRLLQWEGPWTHKAIAVISDPGGLLRWACDWMDAARAAGGPQDRQALLLFEAVILQTEQQEHMIPDPIDRLIARFHANAHYHMTLADCCHLTGLGPSQLTARFRARTGLPPMKHFQRIKAQAATRLLEQGRSLSDVAQRLRLGGASTLQRILRRWNPPSRP